VDGQERIRAGELRGAELAHWLAEHPAAERDRAIERLLGVREFRVNAAAPSADEFRVDPARPGAQTIGYFPSGIAPIVRAVLDVPITADDVFVDLGSGMGKVAIAVHLLTGARTRGVEVRPDLVARARAAAERLALSENVTFVEGDARDADLEDGTVFFLYLPFTGAILANVMERLFAVARRRDLVVCSLGLDLRRWEFLVERRSEEFWLSIYDSRVPGASRRGVGKVAELGHAAERVAREV
jgi:SAM-dependent methyltransferase